MRRGPTCIAALLVALAPAGGGPPAGPLPKQALWGSLEQRTGIAPTPGNELELVENGRVFDVLVEEVARSRQSVHIVVYIWRDSPPSDRLVRALSARDPGVDCRIVYDPLGSRRFVHEVRPRLEAAGCRVLAHAPLAELDTDTLVERQHQKLAVFDGRVGITGGFGIWKSWVGDGRSEDAWRDVSVRVRGPAAAQMQRAFERTWFQTGGEPFETGAAPPPEEGGARAAYVFSESAQGEDGGGTFAERLTLALVFAARERIWIANSYFVPSEAVLEALAQKARAGVEVRVLAPGPVHDWRSVRAAQRASYPRLLRAGVRIWEYQPSMMHAKTMLVDDRFVVVGSINLDPLSFGQLDEGALVAEDQALAGALERGWRQDLRHSEEIRSHRRGLLQALARALLRFLGGL